MSILILNWRGVNDPLSGGAEIITFKYANFWAGKGHKVTWVTSKNSNYKKNIKGKHKNLNFVYLGANLGRQKFTFVFRYLYYLTSVFFYLTYKKFTKLKVDKVIDEIHGLPHFAWLIYPKKTILLTCEVAGKDIWHKMYKFPVNIIGLNLEKLVYFIYKNCEIWAISTSTKKDILKLNPKCNVKILPLGIDPIKDFKNVKKNTYPSAIFVARVVKMKGIETAILATKNIIKKEPKFKLTIVGFGEKDYISYLKGLTKKYDIEKNVVFKGFVSNKQKYKLMAKSHFLFHPSFKEGFGLTILEAGLVGTPSIIRGGSSLDELVKDGYNGYCVFGGVSLSSTFIKGYYSKNYNTLCKNANLVANKYLWVKVLKNSYKITGIK